MPPENLSTASPQAPAPKRKKSFLWILLILLLALLAAGYFLTKTKSPSEISGLEVALKIATFLDKTFQSDGRMLGGYTCSVSAAGGCVPFELTPEQPHVGQAIYSFFILAEATGDQSYRVKADRAINWVLDHCDADANVCEWNYFPLVKYYEETGEEKYLTRGMLPPSEKFLTMSTEDLVIGNVGHKLASLYKFTGDVRFKNRLVAVADAELIKPIENPNRTFQVIWSIYLPAYKITNDARYLQASETFFDHYDMAERTKLEKFEDSASIIYLVKAADGLLGLANVVEDKQTYRDKAHLVLQAVMNKLWDTPEHSIFNSDYGFVEDTVADDKNAKRTLFNGWLMKVFVLLANDKFEAPKAI